MATVKNKEKSTLRIAFSWFGYHAMGVLVCLIMFLSIGALLDHPAWQLLAATLGLLVYLMLFGAPAWQLGNQDHNRVKFGRREEDLLRGVKIAAITSIPMFLLGIALILAKAELLPNFYPIYKLLNGNVLAFINLIDGTMLEKVQSAYLTEVSWGAIIGAVCFNFIPMLVGGIHYVLGYKDILIMDKIIYKKKK